MDALNIKQNKNIRNTQRLGDRVPRCRSSKNNGHTNVAAQRKISQQKIVTNSAIVSKRQKYLNQHLFLQ